VSFPYSWPRLIILWKRDKCQRFKRLPRAIYFNIVLIYERIMRWIAGWAWRIGGAVGVLWLVGVALLAPPSPSSSVANDARLSQRLNRAVQELDVLKRQNDDIKNVLQEFTKQVSAMGDGGIGGDSAIVVEDLQRKLEHAQRMLQETDNTGDLYKGTAKGMAPSREYESTRRLVEKGVQESWWYTQDQLKKLRKKVESFDDYKNHIDRILEEGADHTRVFNINFY
ncbi:unnamed protein product, partial [Meganyctiphanes norvegica]